MSKREEFGQAMDARRGHHDHDLILAGIEAVLEGQELLMATAAEVKAALDTETAAIAGVVTEISGVSDDVQRIIDLVLNLQAQIAAGTGDAAALDEVVAGLTANKAALDAGAAALAASNANIDSVDPA